MPSRLAEITRDPSAVKAAPVTASVCPRSLPSAVRVCVSHRPMVPSPEAVATRWPSGENATALISPSWPSGEASSAAGDWTGTSQRRSVPSLPPAASRSPSGEKATACCGDPTSIFASGSPESPAKRRTVPSWPAEASVVPFQLIEMTVESFPSRRASRLPPGTWRTSMERSRRAAASILPSWEKARA